MGEIDSTRCFTEPEFAERIDASASYKMKLTQTSWALSLPSSRLEEGLAPRRRRQTFNTVLVPPPSHESQCAPALESYSLYMPVDDKTGCYAVQMPRNARVEHLEDKARRHGVLEGLVGKQRVHFYRVPVLSPTKQFAASYLCSN